MRTMKMETILQMYCMNPHSLEDHMLLIDIESDNMRYTIRNLRKRSILRCEYQKNENFDLGGWEFISIRTVLNV